MACGCWRCAQEAPKQSRHYLRGSYEVIRPRWWRKGDNHLRHPTRPYSYGVDTLPGLCLASLDQLIALERQLDTIIIDSGDLVGRNKAIRGKEAIRINSDKTIRLQPFP